MISCTCYDFQHGHLCKHAHKVNYLHVQSKSATDDTTERGGSSAETDTPNDTDLVSPEVIGVAPIKTAQDETSMCIIIL